MLNNPTNLKILQAKIDSMSGVIGEAGDTPANSTLRGRIEGSYQHVHNEALVYPTLEAGVTVIAGTPAWALGTEAVVIPEGTFSKPFDIHWIVWENLSQTGVYELQLFGIPFGGTDPELIGSVRATRTTNQDRDSTKFMETPIVKQGSAISAKLACSVAGAEATISIQLHDYDI